MGQKPGRIFMLGAAALAGAALASSEYEKRHFVVDRCSIRSGKIRKPLTMVFLSDLHENYYPPKKPGEKDQLSRAVEILNPDVILIGGDMIVRHSHGTARYRRTLDLLQNLADICPVIYANGNHEDRLDQSVGPDREYRHPFFRAMSGLGVLFLRDRSIDIGSDIRLTSCTIPEELYRCKFRIPVMADDYLENRVGAADPEKYQILMLHSPQFFRNAAEWGADLTLSGHFHGGTIRIPGVGGLMTPQYQFFRPECAGRFEKDGHTMIVSRGLGTHSVNLRLNNWPELLWLQFEPEDADESDRYGNFI